MGKSKGQKGAVAASIDRPVDVSRLDLRVGRIVSAEKVCFPSCGTALSDSSSLLVAP